MENQGRLLATAACALERIQRVFDRVPHLDTIDQALLVRLASINDRFPAADVPSLPTYDFSRMRSDELGEIAQRLNAGDSFETDYSPPHSAANQQAASP